MLFLKHGGRTHICHKANLPEFLSLTGIDASSHYFVSQAKVVGDFQQLDDWSTVQTHRRLLGGKGGFGAKLKNEGGKKVKPNENMFSRDTHGRPIAYSTLEKDYKQYYAKKQEENEKVKKEINEFRVMENTLKEEYTSHKLDKTYKAEIDEVQAQFTNSLKSGLTKYFAKAHQQTTSHANASEKRQNKNQQQQLPLTIDKEWEFHDGKRLRKQVIVKQQSDKGPMKMNKPLQSSMNQLGGTTMKLASAKLKNIFKK